MTAGAAGFLAGLFLLASLLPVAVNVAYGALPPAMIVYRGYSTKKTEAVKAEIRAALGAGDAPVLLEDFLSCVSDADLLSLKDCTVSFVSFCGCLDGTLDVLGVCGSDGEKVVFFSYYKFSQKTSWTKSVQFRLDYEGAICAESGRYVNLCRKGDVDYLISPQYVKENEGTYGAFGGEEFKLVRGATAQRGYARADFTRSEYATGVNFYVTYYVQKNVRRDPYNRDNLAEGVLPGEDDVWQSTAGMTVFVSSL